MPTFPPPQPSWHPLHRITCYPGYHYIYHSFKNPYLQMFYIHREMSGCKSNFVLFMLSCCAHDAMFRFHLFTLMVLLLLW
jgi:hypothetical protein